MEYQPTRPADRCTEHDGAHALSEGRCFAFGRQVPRRRFAFHFGRCDGCGIDLDFRRDSETGRGETLAAGTDERHHHAPDRTGDKLATVADGLGALQATLAAMLEERRAARAPSKPAEAQAPARSGEHEPLGGVPTVT